MQRNGYGWEGRTISYKKIICLVALLCFSTQAYGQSYTPVINLLFINSGGAIRVLGDSLYFVQADGDTAWILDVTDTPTSGQVLTTTGANKVATWETSRAGGVDFADSVTHDSRRVPGDSLMTDAESEARRGWTDDGTVVRLVTAGDSVGIGTSIPQSEFDVQSDTAATITLATKQTAVLDGAQIGRIDFNAPLESSGSNSVLVGASIWAEADIDFTTVDNKTEIVFATATTGAVSERMRITSAGVGIGETSPSQLLEVAGTGVVAHFDATQSAALWLDRGATTRSAEVRFLTAETPNWYVGTTDSDVSGDGSEFFVGTSAQGASPAFWIETNGNVGINTNVPNAKLQVAGVVNIDGFDTGNFVADEYDLRLGSTTNDSAAVMRIGNLEFGTSDDRTIGASLTAGGTVFFGVQNAPDGIGEFIFTEAGGDIRMAIPIAGVGYGTANLRSGMYAGPSVMKDSIMIGSYWGFNRLAMDTGNKGADLGVQNNVQIGDSLYVNTAILIGGKQFTTQGDSTLIKGDLIYTSGNVGVGTASPSDPLTVGGSSASFVVTRETVPAGTDSMFSVRFPSGFPTIALAGAGDDWIMTTNASDQAVFENADGGYTFADGPVGIGVTTAASPLHVDSNGANTVDILTLENTAGDIQLFRTDATPEASVTGSIGDLAIDGTNGVLYLKESGFASNTGWGAIGGIPSYKSYSLANPGNAGTFYVGGHYAFAAADANLTIGGAVTQTFGTAGQAHGTHAFVVASGAGGTDLVLTVTGVSITDAGVRNGADSEIIVADADAASTDEYFETSKKWLGQITYTLTGAAGTFDFNYGFVKYDDFGNRDFTVTDFEGTGEARANETGLNIELLYHEATAFVYHASAFIPNQTALVSMATDYSTDNDVASGDGFAYKRTGLTQLVDGNSGEGLIIRITTAVNNSINDASFHIGVLLK